MEFAEEAVRQTWVDGGGMLVFFGSWGGFWVRYVRKQLKVVKARSQNEWQAARALTDVARGTGWRVVDACRVHQQAEESSKFGWIQ